MARLLPAPLVGVLTFVLKFFVLIFWFTLMLPGVLLHLIPSRALRDRTSRYCVWIGWAAMRCSTEGCIRCTGASRSTARSIRRATIW